MPDEHHLSDTEYDDLIWRLREVVDAVVPRSATVAVVSRGDERLVDLPVARALHFPADEEGRYAGWYPKTSREAVAQLEAVRDRGADFLLLPETSLWWLGHYRAFARHLEREGEAVLRDPHTCTLYRFPPRRRRSPRPAAATPRPGWLTFRCNVCGTESSIRLSRLEREGSSCPGCGSSARFRAVVYVLAVELFGRPRLLTRFPRRRLRGIGMTDWAGYAEPLARCFDYTNTFFDGEPQLDITDPDPELFGTLDFLISSDVFEHVAPPISLAFANARRLLKPDGVLVCTVPFDDGERTVEHFPDLHRYSFGRRGDTLVLRNRSRDGKRREYRNLTFHGGQGATLEMRLFARGPLLDELHAAGFSRVRVYDEPIFEHGIYWPIRQALPIAARP